MSKPSSTITWATVAGTRVVPPSDKAASGFGAKEYPGPRVTNNLIGVLGEWSQYLSGGAFDDGLGVGVATGTISPSALTTTTNDYNPTGFGTAGPGSAVALRLTTDGGGLARITGIAGGYNGRLLILVNTHATDVIKLDNQSGSSTATNRLIVQTGLASGSIIMYPGDVVVLWYDGTTARWRVIGGHYSYHAQLFFPGSLWQDANATHAQNVAATGIFRGYTIAASVNPLAMPLAIPDGVRILGWHLSANKTSNGANTINARLYQEGDGTDSALGAGASNNANNPGSITLSETGLAIDVGQAVVGVSAFTSGYYLRFLPGGATGDKIFNVSLDIARIVGG